MVTGLQTSFFKVGHSYTFPYKSFKVLWEVTYVGMDCVHAIKKHRDDSARYDCECRVCGYQFPTAQETRLGLRQDWQLVWSVKEIKEVISGP